MGDYTQMSEQFADVARKAENLLQKIGEPSAEALWTPLKSVVADEKTIQVRDMSTYVLQLADIARAASRIDLIQLNEGRFLDVDMTSEALTYGAVRAGLNTIYNRAVAAELISAALALNYSPYSGEVTGLARQAPPEILHIFNLDKS